jgi:hypothetical protein
VIDELRGKYPVSFLCAIMDVNRSGYYKWKARQGTGNRYEKIRIELTALLMAEHEKHPSYGYHRLAYEVFKQTGWIFSHINAANMPGYGPAQGADATESRVRKVCGLKMR